MFSQGTGYSLSDIAAVSGANRSNDGGWGSDGGAWWIIILFLFCFMGGWGNGGWGGNGGGSATQGALTRGDLCMDMNFNDLQGAVRNINDGVNLGFSNLNSTICHQQYDTAMLVNGVTAAVNGGFAGLNSTICQQQYDTAAQLNGLNNTISSGFNAANIVALQGQNAIESQLAQCCCDQRAATADLKYTIASEDCATRNLIQTATRDMIDTNNANTRAILDKLTAQEIAAKDAQIAAQTQRIFGLELAASQAAQNAYLVGELAPKFPIPAYPVPNPFVGYGYNCGCGYNNFCA